MTTSTDQTERSILHATFTLERDLPHTPDVVFAAWADPAVKVRWFSGNPSDYVLDFRVGGLETNTGEHEGMHLAWESLYREIVDDRRIVYTSVLSTDGRVDTVSLTTVELDATSGGTHLTLVESGAYLDGHELPEWREEGTSSQLEALGRVLSGGPGLTDQTP